MAVNDRDRLARTLIETHAQFAGHGNLSGSYAHMDDAGVANVLYD